jgi:acyl carrier protein
MAANSKKRNRVDPTRDNPPCSTPRFLLGNNTPFRANNGLKGRPAIRDPVSWDESAIDIARRSRPSMRGLSRAGTAQSGETMDARAPQADNDADRLRTLIAEYLGIDADQVTDEAHLSDLGLDWLDELELMILIEDEFAGVEFSDANVEEIAVVGDLIRQVEMSHRNAASTLRKSAA